MKQKILIGAGLESDKAALFAQLKSILSGEHEYFLTILCMDHWMEAVVVANHKAHENDHKSTSFVKRIEFEMEMETLASEARMNIDFIKPALNAESLQGLSSVADLLVLDNQLLSDNAEWHLLRDFLETIKCPVLILPEQGMVSRLLMMHNPSEHSLEMVKHFLRLFNHELMKMPMSVLFNFPEDNEMDNQKFFVDYLKMAFPNLGLQLMVDEPIEEFLINLKSDVGNALILSGNEFGDKILYDLRNRTGLLQNSPIFIFKH